LEDLMDHRMLCVFASLMAIYASIGSAAAEQRTSYPQVRVELVPSFTPDAALGRFRKQFINAVAKKDINALSALVAPGFVWTVNNELSSDFDPGRDPLHNFRVAFGFRVPGQDVDGKVENGPYWDFLQSFANDNTFYQVGEGGKLICSPTAATVASEEVYERAIARVEATYEDVQWFFAVRGVPVAKAPEDTGPPIGKLGTEAFPVISVHPEGAEVATHYEVLLPSGRTGWIPANAARALQADRLCYAPTANGEWKIAIYDSTAE
jgi:hypothetical protein